MDLMLQELNKNSHHGTDQANKNFLLMKCMVWTRFKINGGGNMKKVATYDGKDNQKAFLTYHLEPVHHIAE